MGNSQEANNSLKQAYAFKLDAVQQQIQLYQNVDIDKRIFTNFLFSKFDQNPHPSIGRIVVSNTYILEQFFLVLTNKNKEGKLKASKLNDEISKIYKNPEKAIEYSFRLMDLDDDKKITKAEFLSYIDNCFISLQFAAEKHITDEQFALNFKNWVKSNKKIFLQNVLQVFEDNAKTSPQFWSPGDFTRWIKDKNHWSLDIQIGAVKLRTPINLLCLFAIQL